MYGHIITYNGFAISGIKIMAHTGCAGVMEVFYDE
jgi:hypothetical protein